MSLGFFIFVDGKQLIGKLQLIVGLFGSQAHRISSGPECDRVLPGTLRRAGGALVRVETSSTEGYGAAQRCYESHGYPQACRIPGFYKPGDDLIIMFKRL